MTDKPAAISDLTLERYRLDELPEADRIRVARLIEQDPAVAARLRDIEADNDALQRDGFVQMMSVRVRTQSGTDSSPSARSWWLAGASVAAVFTLFAIAWPFARTASPPTSMSDDGARVKGSARLILYRKAGAGSETLADGAAANRGDLIRVAYVAAGEKYGVIVSIDGRRTVTRHLPRDGAQSPALDAGKSAGLDQAYELDDAPGWEEFVLITSARPFDVSTVIDAAQRAVSVNGDAPPKGLQLPAEFHQATFLLRKPLATTETRR